MRYILTKYVPAGSVVLTLTTFVSYAMGLVRDRIFARTFGLSAQLDAYNAAFLLPDFLFNLLVASGIAAAVVPLFSQLTKQSREEAWEYIDTVVNTAALTMAAVALALFIGAPWASVLVAPGLPTDDQELTARLIRILALSPILFALSNGLGAMLVANKRFLFYGLSPVLYNFGIIAGVLWLAPRYGIIGAALGTILGACLHTGIRVVDAYRSGWRYHWRLNWKLNSFRRTLRLMAPKMVGHPVEMLMFWGFTSLASTLSIGSISALNFARNFQSVPVSLIGISMATAAFPQLSEALAGDSRKQYTVILGRVFGSIAAISTLAAILLYLVRVPLISTLLSGGSFDAEAAQRTANVLAVFCLAIPTESVNHLLARAFYARQNTIVPVAFSILALLAAVGFGWWQLPRLGIVALPLGFFLGSLLKSIGLMILAYKQAATSRQ